MIALALHKMRVYFYFSAEPLLPLICIVGRSAGGYRHISAIILHYTIVCCIMSITIFYQLQAMLGHGFRHEFQPVQYFGRTNVTKWASSMLKYMLTDFNQSIDMVIAGSILFHMLL